MQPRSSELLCQPVEIDRRPSAAERATGKKSRRPDHRRTAPRWTGGQASSSGGFRSSCACAQIGRASIACTTGYAETTSPCAAARHHRHRIQPQQATCFPAHGHRAARATSICMTPQSSTSTNRHRPSYYCVSQAA